MPDKDKTLLLKYDSRFNINKYKNNKNFDDLSFSSKVNYLKEFHNKLMYFKDIKSMDKNVELKQLVCDNTFDIYN